MSFVTHPHSPHHKLEEIARKLQHEVDSIINKVDEKALFAEFRDEEIMDIREGADRKEIMSTLSLEERIILRNQTSQKAPILKISHIQKKYTIFKQRSLLEHRKVMMTVLVSLFNPYKYN